MKIKILILYILLTQFFLFPVMTINGDNLVETFEVSSDIGNTMERIPPGPRNLTLICILDAHTNPDAQRKIAKILEKCSATENIRLIGIEGATGVVAPNVFKTVPESDLIENLLDNYIREGTITGVEYYATRINPDAVIYGVEEGPLYLENLTIFRETSALSPAARTFVTAVEEKLAVLQEKLYEPELTRIIELKKHYQDGEVTAPDFILHLGEYRKKSQTDWEQFRQLQNFQEAVKLHETIDFEAVKNETSSVIKDLEKSLSKEKLQELIKTTLKYRLGKIPEKTYHEMLENMLRSIGKNLSDYKNLSYFVHYRRLTEKIDYETLFNEIEQAAEREITALLRTPEQRNLYKLQDTLSFLQKALSLELSRSDLIKYRDILHTYTANDILSRSNDLLINNGLPLPGENALNFTEDFDNALDKVNQFYEIAIRRDEAMLDNILREMYRRRQDRACIVVGGFHKDGIVSLSRERGIGCIVITPNITEIGDTTVYHRAMTGIRLPLTQKLKNAQK